MAHPERGRPGRPAVFLALIAALVLAAPPGRAGSGGTPAGELPPGWEEDAPGWRMRLPGRTVEALDNAVRGTFSLPPGTGIILTRSGTFPLDRGEALEVAMIATGTNAASRDYVPGDARFPVSVTVVFGNDGLESAIRKRALQRLRGLRHGRSLEGIGLTYAWGNGVPAGSMYRLEDNETVFILAGSDETGRRVSDRRDLRQDFAAAYGRAPQGPVTRFVVRAERPSREEGTIRAEVLLAFPGL